MASRGSYGPQITQALADAATPGLMSPANYSKLLAMPAWVAADKTNLDANTAARHTHANSAALAQIAAGVAASTSSDTILAGSDADVEILSVTVPATGFYDCFAQLMVGEAGAANTFRAFMWASNAIPIAYGQAWNPGSGALMPISLCRGRILLTAATTVKLYAAAVTGSAGSKVKGVLSNGAGPAVNMHITRVP